MACAISLGKSVLKDGVQDRAVETTKEISPVILSKLIELDAGKLYWAPAGVTTAEADSMQAWRLVADEETSIRRARYGVCHFSVDRVATFGPPAIDQIVIFCRLCQKKLQEHKSVLVVTNDKKSACHANVAVLLGAWLVLGTGCTAADAGTKLGARAQIRFPCSWARTPDTSTASLTPVDCLLGLEAAKFHGWLDFQTFDVESYQEELHLYDVCWLVPSEILVGADPCSTVADPDPQTCTALLPSSSWQPSFDRQLSPVSVNSCAGGCASGNTGFTNLTIEIPETPTTISPDSPGMTHSEQRRGQAPMLSPCKAYGAQKPVLFGRQEHLLGVTAADFATYLISSDVKVCVRANMIDEPGLEEIGNSYDPSIFTSMGIVHVDVPFPDTGACLPPPKLLREVLQSCRSAQASASGAAAFFHCKSGFGRSVLYACCLLTSRYDIPGGALLGWVRLVRPGSVTCASQEKIMRSLCGMGEIDQYLGGIKSCCTLL